MSGNYLTSMTPEEEAQLAAAFTTLAQDYAEPTDTDTPPPPTDDDETPDDKEEGDDETPEGDEETTPEEDSIDLGNGTTLSRTEVAKLHELSKLMDSGSRATLEQVRQIPQPVAAVPTPQPSQALTPPEGLDLDDPSIKLLWDGYTSLHANQVRINEENLRRQNQEAVEQVERSISDWNDKYHLDDSNLAIVRDRAGKTNVAAALISSGRTTYEAVNAALEQAFWSDESLRSQYLTAAAADEAVRLKSQKAKERKLSALSGRGTSTGTSKPPAEMTREERTAAMTREIAEHLARS